VKNKPITLTALIALGLLAPAAWAQSGSRFAAPLPQSGAASSATTTIQWGTKLAVPPAAAPATVPAAAPSARPATGPAAGPAAHLGAQAVVPSTGTGTRSLSEILALPDSQVLPATGGGSTTAGEVKRRYAQWMKGELARRKPAAPVRVARQTTSRVPRVGAVAMAAGAAMRQADPALINELRSMDTSALVRSGTAVGQVSLQGPGRKLVGAPMAPALPCTSAQAAFANGSAHYLSTVNKRPKDFWVNLDADERMLVLSGCFDKTPGEVRITGNFPGGQVKAQVVLWEERVIVAQMPVMTGLVDQDISVRVVLANRQSTNERSGHLWAKREEKQLDDLTLYASTGDCPGKAFRSPQGPALQAGYPPKYLEGTHSEGALTPSPVTAMKTCELPQGAVAPSGVTHFKTRLAPGWEVVNLSLRPYLGNARREWVGESDFDVHWTAASFKASHEVLGIPTGTELFHALQFTVDQVVVRGPAGTAHLAR
jgi:hypothetical protein